MVVRMWHGRVRNEKAQSYRRFLCDRAVLDYRSIQGIIEVLVLERIDGNETHFITLTKWQDKDAIRRFAGADPEVAKYYPEDKEYLLEFEPKVVHYEIVE